MIYFLKFNINDIIFAVPIDEINEVARPKKILKKRKLARHFTGFIELRKENVPVFDLHEFFGLEESEKFEVIIFRINKKNIAIKVDKVSGIITAEELQSYPEFIKHDSYLKGVIIQDENVVQVLSLIKLMSGQRLKAIKKYL
ncbi:MAG: chemotaxis protein CheW [bacterium]